jgi:hypothetical protein
MWPVRIVTKKVILFIVGFHSGSVLMLIVLQGLCTMLMWALIHMTNTQEDQNQNSQAFKCFKKTKKSDSTKEHKDSTEMLMKTASGYMKLPPA